MSQKKFKLDLTLEYPVPVKGADGKDVTRNTITMNRPRTVHVKRLAVLLGTDLLKAVLGDSSALNREELEKIDIVRLFLDVVETIFTHDALAELTSITASMCNEEPDFIDQLDPVDLMTLLTGMVDFFPTLRSLGSTNSGQTQQRDSAGDPTT
ncbi:hypothetical protein CQ054_05800 [Ochrobactrum sp. MYb29]|nr:hypothetical protein CQ054_05800 [Ochrobactrum sp. MYb29]